METTLNKRTALWDNLRFILITTVAIGHFINISDSETYLGIFIFIYSFHMPLFMFVSGLFHKNNNIIRKFIGYVAIYMIFELSIFAVKRAYGKKVKFNPWNESAAPWFMLVLAFFVVLGYFLRNCNKVAVLTVSVILSLAAGYFSQINDFLCLSRVFYFFPFYYLGMSVKREKIEELAKNKRLRILGLIVVVVAFVTCMLFTGKALALRPFITGKAGYPETKYAVGAIWRLGVYGIAIVLSAAFILITPANNIKVITTFGQRTIQVYFWHRIILYVLTLSGIADYFYSNGVLKLVWIGVAVVVTFITSLKVFEFPTGTIVRLIRYKKKEK